MHNIVRRIRAIIDDFENAPGVIPPPSSLLTNSYITENGLDFYVTEMGDPYITEN